MQIHRIILIGHGNITKSYLQAFAGQPNAEIVGVVGRNEEKVAAFAAEHSIAVAGTDVARVAGQSRATIAVICTPNAAHYNAVMQASQAGLHCLCEKPLDISPERQQEMVSSCNSHGVLLGVSYMRRFIPHFGYIKQLIDSNQLGRIMVIDVMIKHFRDAEYYNSWHGTKEIDGGGPFIQQGSHIIDIALWLMGGYTQVLTAKCFQVYHDIEAEDHGYAVLQYANGAIGMITASTASPGMKQEGIEISGTRGSVAADYRGFTRFEVPGVDPPVFDPADSENPVLFASLVRNFLSSVESGTSPFVDGSSAQAATELVMEIYRSAGDPVRTFS